MDSSHPRDQGATFDKALLIQGWPNFSGPKFTISWSEALAFHYSLLPLPRSVNQDEGYQMSTSVVWEFKKCSQACKVLHNGKFPSLSLLPEAISCRLHFIPGSGNV